MSEPLNNVGRHRFAVATAAATLLLLGAGGLVTSHGAGMAVPDWPNTYGYNLFLFPVSRWVGGVFYEHAHRLIASSVGLMTGVLALWLYGRQARPVMRWSGLVLMLLGLAGLVLVPKRWTDGVVLGAAGVALLGASFAWPRCEPAEKWLRRLGWMAFMAVVLQGVLGGLRVVLFKDQIGIVHATLAQIFFALVCAIALFTSNWWMQLERQTPADRVIGAPKLRRLFVCGTILVFLQLIVGAAMRHQHAGLAVPDFPLAYGKLWPATDAESVAHYNAQRVEVTAANPITAFQIELQMAHRILAGLVLAAVAFCSWVSRRQLAGRSPVTRLATIWLGLILIQAGLGAATVLSNKAADIATAHVLAGALSLATGTVLCLLAFRFPLAVQSAPVSLETADNTVDGHSLAAKAAAAHPS